MRPVRAIARARARGDWSRVAGRCGSDHIALPPKLRRDILDVLAQTAGFTLIGVLVIETTLHFF